MYHGFVIHSSADGYLGCFHFLAIINSAVTNIRVHVSPILNPSSHLHPHPIPQGHPNALAPSTLYHASNLDRQFISHVIIYMFQCHSPIPSRPLPHPQSPKDCSIHLCLFCCLSNRVIITIFLNSIYMHYYTVLVFFLSGLLHSV